MRIVTRPDFDGLVCAVLLTDALEKRTPIKWAEPNAVQNGLVEILDGDVIANLAYNEKCCYWFDHHLSNKTDREFRGSFDLAPSAARVIYNYFQGKFSRDFSELVYQTDKIDSADLCLEEVLYPEKHAYISLDMTIGRRKKDDESYCNKLVTLLRDYSIEDVLKDPEVKKRINIAIQENKIYKDYLKRYTSQLGKITLTDFRSFKKAPFGNRFLVFSLFPDSYANIKIRNDHNCDRRVIVSLGHSTFNDGCKANAGKICSRFGGGGHPGAGSCSFPPEDAEKNLGIILRLLQENSDQTG